MRNMRDIFHANVFYVQAYSTWLFRGGNGSATKLETSQELQVLAVAAVEATKTNYD